VKWTARGAKELPQPQPSTSRSPNP
jgi:hypothetical protein